MFSMIKSNRQFKTLLRKTLTGWEALHGEVSFDELLLINAFRVTNPCMLNFMSELREYLNSAGCWGDSIKDKKKANEEGKQKIEMLFHQHVGNNHLQADRLKGLVGLLIPKTDRESIGIDSRPILLKWKEERYQSITSTRYTDYWNRILNEDIPEGELRDQEVWKLIDKWKQNPDTCLGLPQKIADDKEWAKKFEQFQSVLEDNDIFLRLASQHMKALRQTYGNKANADSPGFNEIWNVSRERNIKGEKKCDWIKKEIDKSICVSIELVNNLMELWGPEKKPDPSPGDNKGTILPEKRKELLKHVIEIMKHNYTGRDSGDRLAKALFSDSSKIPNTLNYLMRWHDEDKKYEREGLSGPEAWRFMADAVLAATEEHPDVMLPQVVILVGKTKSPGSDTYQFDETVIAKMFNDKKKDLMSLLAKQTDLPTGLDDQTKNDILMARELAQESEGTAAVKMPQSIKTKNPVNPV